jgi:UDP-glucose 4-epimerase
MNVVITGGAGFIGSRLSELLMEAGHQVTVVDVNESCIGDVHMIRRDILHIKPKEWKDILRCNDVIVHAACVVGVNNYDADVSKSVLTSNQIDANIIRAVTDSDIKLIYFSTSEVYGDCTDVVESHQLTIGSPVEHNRWGYACNKLMSEFLIRCSNIPAVIIRPFNVTGLGQGRESGMVVPMFVDSVVRGIDINIYGTGEQIRTFCDIRDAVKMIHLLMDDEHLGQTYNIGNHNNIISMNDLAVKVKQLTGGSCDIINTPRNCIFTSQVPDINIRIPNTNKINRIYTPQYSIDDIITSMV